MRRVILAFLGAVATAVALVSGRFFLTAPAGASQAPGQADGGIPALGLAGGDTTGSDWGANPSDRGDASPGASGSAQPSQSAGPGAPTGNGASPAANRPGAGGQNNGGGNNGGGNGGNNGGGGNQPQSCKTYDGPNQLVGGNAHYATVYVTIKVCDGAITSANGGVMLSEYEPTNSNAIAALNQLAVRYYKSNISMIAYSGATATAAAYRRSLQGAMSEAGI